MHTLDKVNWFAIMIGSCTKFIEAKSVCSARVLCHTAIECNSGSSGRSCKYMEKRV